MNAITRFFMFSVSLQKKKDQPVRLTTFECMCVCHKKRLYRQYKEIMQKKTWEQIVGADIRRRLRQSLPVPSVALRNAIRRVPDEVRPNLPYLLDPSERAQMNALVAVTVTAPRARAFLRLLRSTSEATYHRRTYVFDLNSSDDDDDEPVIPPPKRRRSGSGKRGGLSKRSSNRHRIHTRG